jgi:hypothetical protein
MKTLCYLVVGALLTTLATRTSAAALSIAAREIHLNGHDLFVDSYDSSDPARSTGGHYDPLKGGGDQVVVGTEAGILNANNVGTVDVWGRLETGPVFSLEFGPQSSIGSISWHQASQMGIEPGYHTTNLVWEFPDVAPPLTAGLVPIGGTYDGVYYDYILTIGDYRLPSLVLSGGQKMLVTGVARLDIPGNVNLTGNGQVVILPEASLQLFVAGTANLRGGGIINQGVASHFIFFGVGLFSELNLRVATPFVGGIYAPRATCTITSAGGSSADLQGAVVTRSIQLGADLDFHFDEAPGQ